MQRLRTFLNLAICLTLTTACGSKKELHLALPQESVVVVMAVDPGLTPLQDTSSRQLDWATLVALLQADSAQCVRFAQTMRTDWLHRGTIATDKPVLFANLVQDILQPAPVPLAHLSIRDRKALEAALHKAFPSGEFSTKDCGSRLLLPGVAMIWDDHALVILPRQPKESRTQELLETIARSMPCHQQQRPTLAEIPAFQEWLAKIPGDTGIGLFGNYRPFTQRIPEPMLNLVGLEKKDLDDNYMISSLKQQGNHLAYEINMVWSEGIRNYFMPMEGPALGQEVLYNLPADSVWMFMGYGLDIPHLVANIRKPLSRIPALGAMSRQIAGIEEALGMPPAKLMDIFTGQMVFVVQDFAGDLLPAANTTSLPAQPDHPFAQLNLRGILGVGVQDSTAAFSLVSRVLRRGDIELADAGGGLLLLRALPTAAAPTQLPKLYMTYARGYLWIGNATGLMRTLRRGLPKDASRMPKEVLATGKQTMGLYVNLDGGTQPPGMTARHSWMQLLTALRCHHLFGESGGAQTFMRMGIALADKQPDYATAVRKLTALYRYYATHVIQPLQHLTHIPGALKPSKPA
ncbi:MAG: hypothetical protein KF690_01955 [Bacteroidetes bacterium]|nr:hypothetical protein [Bacteroidota bacterium]